jgi:EpsI family protein
MDNLKFYIIIAVLGLAAFIGLSSYLPTRFESGNNEVQVSLFPMKVGQWMGKDVPLTQRDYDILETKNLVMRQYTDPAGRSVLLYIIYSGDNRKVLHPPEVCYLGGGATITEKGMVPVSPRIQANKMVTELGGTRQLVVYWYKAGAFNTPVYFKQQLNAAIGLLLGKKKSSSMIRISVDLKEGENASAVKMMQEFAAEIEPLLPRYVP